MRHIITLFACIFLLKTTAFAEQDSTTVLKDSVRTVVVVPDQLIARSYQLMSVAGITPMPYTVLNEVLDKSNYINVAGFSPGWLGGSPAYNIELQAILGSPDEMQGGFILNFGYVTSGAYGVDSNKAVNVAIRLRKFSGEFGGSVRVFKNSWFALYPFYFFSPELNNLVVEEVENQSWDYNNNENFIDKFNSTKSTTSLTATSFSAGIGIGTDISLFSHKYIEDTQITWLLGMRASYQFGLFTFPWYSGTTSLMNAPDVSASGLRLSAGLGWSIDNRIYKAKIISEEK